jgi:hypothetical protein
MGDLFAKRNQKQKAVTMYTNALSGFALIQGEDSKPCQSIHSHLKALDMKEKRKLEDPAEAGRPSKQSSLPVQL